jgi:hypothetical protein
MLRASTSQQRLLGTTHGPELRFEVGPEVCQTQLQARDAIASVTRTITHIVKGLVSSSAVGLRL